MTCTTRLFSDHNKHPLKLSMHHHTFSGLTPPLAEGEGDKTKQQHTP